MYEPTTGRFTSLDPYFGNTNDPQSFHKYLYTHADPVNGTDPSGLMNLGNVMSAMTGGASLMGRIGLTALRIGYTAGRSLLLGPFSTFSVYGLRLAFVWRALSFGFVGSNISAWLALAYNQTGSLKEKLARATDDLLSHYPWWITDRGGFTLPSSPEGIVTSYKDVINGQQLVPPELLASVLLAEMRHYNVLDSLFDDPSDRETSIGIAQIRIDTIERLLNGRPELFPAEWQTISSDDRDALIGAALTDPANAIQMLSISLKHYALKGNIDLANWETLPEARRRYLVEAFTSAKDSIEDSLEISNFGTSWGLPAYDYIKTNRLLE